MHVLIVTQYFAPEQFIITDVAYKLRRAGFEVSVLTGFPNYPGGTLFPGYSIARGPYHETMDGIAVHRVPLITRGQGVGPRRIANYLSWAALASVYAAVGRFRKVDVVFAFCPSPLLSALPATVVKILYRKRFVLWVQDLWPETLVATGAVRSAWVLSLVGRLVRFIFEHCDRILVQSGGFVDSIAGQGIDLAKISVLPNWAEPLYRPIEVPPDAPERAELPSGFRLIFAGNLGAAQSIETLVEAAEIVHRSAPEVKWIFIGGGLRLDWLRDTIARRNLASVVHAMGPRPKATMPTYFALADALVVSLTAAPVFNLTVPSKVQSYLACARPIVGSIDGEAGRIIRESGAGLVAPAGDAAALAQQVVALYHLSAEARRKMGERGRQYFLANFEGEMLLKRLVGHLAPSSSLEVDAVGTS